MMRFGRRRRRRTARLAAAAGAALGAWLITAGAAGAEPVSSVESGWWNLATPSQVALPPETSSTQLQVSNGAQGPLAFSAVRFTLPSTLNSRPLDPSTAQVTLTLTIVGNTKVGTPSIAACPTTTTWNPGPDQPAGSAPGYYCGGGKQSTGTLSSSGTTESWSLTTAAQTPTDPTVHDVALVPAPGTTSPFSINYDTPTSASVTVRSTATAGSSVGGNGGSAGSAGAPAANPAPSVTSPPSPAPVSPGGSASGAVGSTGPSVLNPLTALSGSPAPAAPGPKLSPVAPGANGRSASSGSTAGGSSQPASAAPASSHHGTLSTRDRRLLGLVVLVGIAGALFYADNRPDRQPRLLGSLGARALAAGAGGAAGGAGGAGDGGAALVAEPKMGGLGRFARPRTEPARRI